MTAGGEGLVTGVDGYPVLDVDGVRRRAERAVAERAGAGPVELRDVEPFGADATTLLHTATLSIGGRSRPVVLKQLGVGALLPGARRVAPAAVLDACREALVYRDVLPDVPGPPKYLGHQLDPDGRDGVLVLARVDGVALDGVAGLEEWIDAARWLGRFHSSRTLRPVPSSVLVQYDHLHRATVAGRARRVAADGGPGAHDVGGVLEVFERVAAPLLAGAPTTFVHGALHPSEVVVGGVRPDGTVNDLRRRIAVVDWECAGVGPALLDLAALLTGRRSPAQRELLLATYAEVAPRFAEGDVGRVLAACRLELALQRLGWFDDEAPVDHLGVDWTAEAFDACHDLT